MAVVHTYSAVPNRQGAGTIANFEEKVPPQDAYLALVMHDKLNLSPLTKKKKKKKKKKLKTTKSKNCRVSMYYSHSAITP